MFKRLFIAAFCVISMLATTTDGFGAFFYFDRNGDTVDVAPCDSVILVLFKSGWQSGGGTPSGFAASVNGLSDSYVPWEWTDDYYVFGVDSGVTIEDVLDSVKVKAEVGVVNPIVSVPPDYLMWMTETFIVRFHAWVTESEMDSINAINGVTVVSEHPFLINQFILRIPLDHGTDILSVCRAYWQSGLCVFAQPDFCAPAMTTSAPNDPRFQYQWHLENNGASGTADADVDADSAWMVSTGSDAVTIAILDSGLDFDHEDLTGVDTVRCYDYAAYIYKNGSIPVITDGDATFDCSATPSGREVCWHGTAVAGMIAARLNNSIGIAALSPGCKYMILKVWDVASTTRPSVMENAIYHTFLDSQSKADIATCSWTWDPPQDVIILALDSAYAHGVNFVFCSSNDGVVRSPANRPNVVAVGATNPWDLVPSWSGQGDSLDIVAPGSMVWSTDLTGDLPVNPEWDACDGNPDYFCDHFGTSFSAPLVAGTLGLMLSRRYGDLWYDLETQREVLYGTAKDLGTVGNDPVYGHGRLNTFYALLGVIHGDLNNDGFLDANDMNSMIDQVLFDLPAEFHPSLADVNCDGFNDALELNYLIDHLFYGGPAPVICSRYRSS